VILIDAEEYFLSVVDQNPVGAGTFMEMVYRCSLIGQEEIGKRLGNFDYSAVSRERNPSTDSQQ
jgi:hypothetical protein